MTLQNLLTPQIARIFKDNCEKDSTYFARNILGSKCWGKQNEIKKALRDYNNIAVQSSHGIGKTYLAADIVLEFLFMNPDSYVVTTATTAAQVRNILWAEINEKYKNGYDRLKIVKADSRILTTELIIKDRWKAVGLSPRKDTGQSVATSIQGYHNENLLVVIDEAGGVEQAIWDAIKGLLTSKNCKLIAIGNPTHIGTEFYRICKNKPKGWKIFSINTLDTPNIKIYGDYLPTREGCAQLVKNYEADPDRDISYPKLVTARWFVDRWYEWGYDNPLFQSRVLGRFPEMSEDSVFSATDLENAVQLDFEDVRINGIKCLGVDVARFGNDKTVFTVMTGGTDLATNEFKAEVIHIQAIQGKDTVEVHNIALNLYNEFDCEAIAVDDTGVGGGVTDMLRRDDVNVTAFIAAEKPMNDTNYKNLKAEMYFEMAKQFSKDRIKIPNDERLKADLLNIRYEIDLQGKLIITSKEKMKKQGINSPDFGESLMVAYYGTQYRPMADYIRSLMSKNDGMIDYPEM